MPHIASHCLTLPQVASGGLKYESGPLGVSSFAHSCRCFNIWRSLRIPFIPCRWTEKVAAKPLPQTLTAQCTACRWGTDRFGGEGAVFECHRLSHKGLGLKKMWSCGALKPHLVTEEKSISGCSAPHAGWHCVSLNPSTCNMLLQYHLGEWSEFIQKKLPVLFGEVIPRVIKLGWSHFGFMRGLLSCLDHASCIRLNSTLAQV